MIGDITITSLSHHGKIFIEPIGFHKFLCIPLGLEFYFSRHQSLEIFVDIEFYRMSFIGNIITCLFKKMIFNHSPKIIKLLFTDRYLYFFSNKSVSFFPGYFIFIADLSYSNGFTRSRIIEISL
jgi:hypothetical protein